MGCELCPRRCGARRKEGQAGACGAKGRRAARAGRHQWEEPCISGTRGSGTVFFSGCALGCVFCQNESISHHSQGRAMNARELSELFARVEELGGHNLNLVTPAHFAPVIFEALRLRRPGIPVVWNSSGYETVELVEAAARFVDVFLPDLKYFSAETAQQLAGAPDFFPVAMAAIRAMCQAKGAPVYDADGLMQSGTLVRHLILPLRTSESLRILDAIAEELPSGTPVSLMRQYTPMNGVNLPGLDRRLTAREYARVRDYMLALGLEGYLQSRESADSAFTPAFMDGESTRLFPSERADAEN